MTRGAPHRGFWTGPISLLVLALGTLALLSLWQGGSTRTPGAPTQLALLVPDNLAADDVYVQTWQDAATELGFELALLRTSALLRTGEAAAGTALILPDTVHRRMSDALVAALDQRVRDGAKLMLVHDAGVQSLDGGYHPSHAPMARLVGLSYARFAELGQPMASERGVWAEGAAVPLLRLPPGQLMRAHAQAPLSSRQPVPAADEALAIVGQGSARLKYPAFATRGTFDGLRLMHADDHSLVAGLRTLGRGQVLFVNLPLTHLKQRSDGLFLHSFLRYFAQDVAALPQLSPMPDAQGALIMNWQIDTAAAVPAIDTLAALGAFEQGPYSIHLNAGPDLDQPGDGQGLDLAHDQAMRRWVQRFAARGDELGSHGGWGHGAVAGAADVQDPAPSTAHIERNLAAVRGASGRPVREVSAPPGQPSAWIASWLRERGIVAYFSSDDIGMAPTRGYRDGQRGPAGLWAFPALRHGAHASFEAQWLANMPQHDVAAWLQDLADYCAEERTVRLLHFHPPAMALYPQALRDWLRHTAELQQRGALRWTTMARYAAFANERLQIQWHTRADPLARDTDVLQASHPRTLAHFAWLLPVARYAAPRVLEGSAHIAREGHVWRVIAGAPARLRMQLPRQPAQQRAASAEAPHLSTAP